MTAVEQARAYLRIEGGYEDAVLAGLVASALELCAGFTGQVPVVRSVTETLAATGGWVRLAAAPVRAITQVQAVAADGALSALPVGGHAIDIGTGGEGWVRVTAAGVARVRVTASAGLAADWDGLPEALRQGVVRLAAHLFVERDGPGASPPAVVAALWRPYRRMRLS